MLTLEQLRDKVRLIVAERDPAFWENEEIDGYLNDEYKFLVREIIDEGGKYFEEDVDVSSTVNSRLIALPSNHVRIVNLTLDGAPLMPEDRRVFGFDTASGKPRFYNVTGRNIELHPTPDAVYGLVLRQTYLPEDMSEGDDEPDFIEGYEILIAWGAVLSALMKDKQAIQDIAVKYDRLKRSLMKNVSNRITFNRRESREL